MKFIRPIIFYGSETRALRKKEEVRLDIFERKILRRIYGPYLNPRTENGEYETMRSFKTCFKDHAYEGKLQKEG